MEIGTTIWVPSHIYMLYDRIATQLGNISTDQVMSAALTAYAQFLMEEGNDTDPPSDRDEG